MAVGALDLPLVCVCVEPCSGNPGVEPDVARQLELLVDMTEVAPQLVPGGEALAPFPVAPELFHGELVVRHMRIDSRPRVAVPVPDSAQVGAGFEETHAESPPSQDMEQVEPAESVEARVDLPPLLRRSLLAHGRHCVSSSVASVGVARRNPNHFAPRTDVVQQP